MKPIRTAALVTSLTLALATSSTPARAQADATPAAPAAPAPNATATPSPAAAAPAGRQRQGGIIPLDDLMKLLDTDHDGKISKAEATGPDAARFSRWDANGDGFATREEIHNFRISQGIGDDGQPIAGSTPNGQNPQNGARRNRTAAGNPNAAGGRNGGGANASNHDPSTAVLLKGPDAWRFESMAVPTPFAPDIKLKGVEEIRFSPGWGNTSSDEYFTYAFAVKVDGTGLAGADLEDFLAKYFYGLSRGRAKRANVDLDAKDMKAQLAPAAEGAADRFAGQVDFFETKKFKLNVEAQLLPHASENKTVILFLISPSATDSPTWKSLREIGQKAAGNLM